MGDADEESEAGATYLHEAVGEALEAIRATDGDGSSAASVTRGFDGKRKVLAFCDRVKSNQATPSCVIDFPYADKGQGGLNKLGDDRLLERMFCFHDRAVDTPDQWLVVVHVHTLLRWGDRLQFKTAERLQSVTSVNARHAERTPGGTFKQERGKFYVVPRNKTLAHIWQDLYRKGDTKGIVWNPHITKSMPTDDPAATWAYDGLRVVIQKGDALCHQAVVTHGIQQTQKTMRGSPAGEEEVEYEVVGLDAQS